MPYKNLDKSRKSSFESGVVIRDRANSNRANNVIHIIDSASSNDNKYAPLLQIPL